MPQDAASSAPYYLNVAVEYHPTDRVEPTLCQRQVTRSGDIVPAPASDYFAATIRLAFSAAQPVWIPELKEYPSDGDTLAYSLTIAGTVGGVPLMSRKYLTLGIPPGRRVAHASKPRSEYCFVRTLDDVADIINRALEEAWKELAGASSLVLGREPFVSRVGGGTNIFRYTFPEARYFMSPHGADSLDLYFSQNAIQLLGGFSYEQVTPPGAPVSPNGMDLRMKVRSQGYNLVPPPVGGPAIAVPDDVPEGTSIQVDQAGPMVLSAIKAFRLVSDLPCQQEVGGGSDETIAFEPILTDFVPQQESGTDVTFQIYNTGWGNARFVRLVSRSAIASVFVKLESLSWDNVVRTVLLRGPGEFFNAKIGFVPRECVEGYRAARTVLE